MAEMLALVGLNDTGKTRWMRKMDERGLASYFDVGLLAGVASWRTMRIAQIADSAPGETIAIDNPDARLHPVEQVDLVEALRKSKARRVIVAIHSPYMLDAFEPHEVILLGVHGAWSLKHAAHLCLRTGELWSTLSEDGLEHPYRDRPEAKEEEIEVVRREVPDDAPREPNAWARIADAVERIATALEAMPPTSVPPRDAAIGTRTARWEGNLFLTVGTTPARVLGGIGKRTDGWHAWWNDADGREVRTASCTLYRRAVMWVEDQAQKAGFRWQ